MDVDGRAMTDDNMMDDHSASLNAMMREMGNEEAPRLTMGGNAQHVDPRDLVGRQFEQPRGWTCDELGVQFATENREILRFETERGWFYWNKVKWEHDTTNYVVERARLFLRRLTNNFSRKDTVKLGTANWALDMLKVASSNYTLAIKAADWDKDPNIIGTPSGAVNLKNGDFIPAHPSMLVSKSTSADPTDTEDCPRWHQFLDEITGKDSAAILGLQRLAGYALTAETREEKVAILVGDGENGKGAFLEALVHAFGDFATTTDLSVLLVDRYSSSAANKMAVFHGARLVVAHETTAGTVWDDGVVKKVTGGDRIEAKLMYKNLFNFSPTHTLVVSLNRAAMPDFRIVDRGIERRVAIVPFDFKPARADLQLKDKLRAEAPGILKWAINGAVGWHQHGLPICSAWQKATDEYLEEQKANASKSDPKEAFKRWLEECCVVGKEHGCGSLALLKSWRDWTRENRVNTHKFDFKAAMDNAGFWSKKTNAGVVYYGLRL
jgi:putative DNA primase/helicase